MQRGIVGYHKVYTRNICKLSTSSLQKNGHWNFLGSFYQSLDWSEQKTYSTIQTLQARKVSNKNRGMFEISNLIPHSLEFEYIQVDNECLLQELRNSLIKNVVLPNSMERKLVFEQEFPLHQGGKLERQEIQFQDYSDAPAYKEYMTYVQQYLSACRRLYIDEQSESLKTRGQSQYKVPVPRIPAPLDFTNFESLCGRSVESPLQVVYIAPSMSHSANVAVPSVAQLSSAAGGWWKTFVNDRDGSAIDTSTYRVVCGAALGGPYGTSSPLSVCSTTRRRIQAQFPIVTPVDQARAHAWLLHGLDLAALDDITCKPIEYQVGFPSLPAKWTVAKDITSLNETLSLANIPWRSSRDAHHSSFAAQHTPPVLAVRVHEKSSQHCIIGSSMGGMQVLTFAALYPGLFPRVWVSCTTAKTSPSTVAQRSVQRAAIRSDQGWMDGTYAEDTTSPVFRGVDLARMIGTIAYRSKDEFDNRFNWNPDKNGRFDVENYLTHQASSFKFDANCYLCLSHCMDLMDLTAVTGDLKETATRLAKAQLFILGVEQDALLPAAGTHPQAEAIGLVGGNLYYEIIRSQWGHDSFLTDTNQFVPRIRAFLSSGNGVLNTLSAVRELQE